MIEVTKYSPAEWDLFAEEAHKVVFREIRKPDMNRISYALLLTEDKVPLAYATLRELDKESVYWQHGGVFPPAEKNVSAVKCYLRVLSYCVDAGYHRVTTYIENTNKAMLKMALTVGFIPMGIRYFDKQIFLEFLLELKGA